jgi:hypothetical protein
MRTIIKINLLLAAMLAIVALVTEPKPDQVAMLTPQGDTTIRLAEKYEVEITTGTWVDSAGYSMFVPDVPVIHHFDFVPDSTAN